MFGHHDDYDDGQQPPQDNADASAPPAEEGLAVNNAAADQPVEQPAPATPDTNEAPDAETIHPNPDHAAANPAPPTSDDGQAAGDDGDSQGQDWQHPDTPAADDQDQIADIISPAGGFPKRPTYQYPKGAPVPSSPGNSPANADDPLNPELIDIRHRALDELAPLLDELDLPPEDKFRTIMMIIQNSDDERLVKAAYEAAHAIEDEKARAQALLDIINEVNYFTQPPDSDSQN